MRAPPPDPRSVEARELGVEVWHEWLGGLDLLDEVPERQVRRYAHAIMLDELWRAVVHGTHNGPLMEQLATMFKSTR